MMFFVGHTMYRHRVVARREIHHDLRTYKIRGNVLRFYAGSQLALRHHNPELSVRTRSSSLGELDDEVPAGMNEFRRMISLLFMAILKISEEGS